MNINRTILLLLYLIIYIAQPAAARSSLVKYVDPAIGTGAVRNDWSHGRDPLGQCMPGVLMPRGMNCWTAQTEADEAHGRCPYYANKDRIQGFRSSHFINGSATQDYGSVTIMPLLDTLRCQPEARASLFRHEDETCGPDYYSVPLFDHKILAEMTGTSRTAIFRFTYKQAGMAHIVITPNSDEGQGHVLINPARGEVTGCNPAHRIYLGRGETAGFSGHFLVQVQNKVTEYGTYVGDNVYSGTQEAANEKRLGAYLSFPVKAGEEVLVKVATSFCDVDGARRNMQKENPKWNFDRIRKQLTAAWERQLSAIEVEGGTEEDRTLFYTQLYHTAFCPHAFNDVDGRYPSFAGGKSIEQTKGIYYEDFSLWDTYRALHPLITLLYPKDAGEMMQSFVLKYQQSGWLPMFSAWNCFTQEMIGDHTASLFAEAYLKGIRNFDVPTAFTAMLKMAYETPKTYDEYKDGKGRRALDEYIRLGYISLENPVKEAYHSREQTSRTLEYAYDDHCVARMAEALGQHDIAKRLYQRAQNYRNVFDPATGYVGGRHADGHFTHDNRPDRGHSWITQGTPCQYSWYVPHDVPGLMDCMGGRDEYIARLDSMFSHNRMWHGNEPGHQISFMYNYAGQPWKTQREVRRIMRTEYGVGANGLSGNDDSGQMAAWYVFAAIGMYPVSPVDAYYNLASPAFERITIHMQGGKRFIIEAPGASDENVYVQSATLNGRPYNKSYLMHSDMARGGTLRLTLGSTPNHTWGTRPEDCPPAQR